jgi:hypothetical protein
LRDVDAAGWVEPDRHARTVLRASSVPAWQQVPGKANAMGARRPHLGGGENVSTHGVVSGGGNFSTSPTLLLDTLEGEVANHWNSSRKTRPLSLMGERGESRTSTSKSAPSAHDPQVHRHVGQVIAAEVPEGARANIPKPRALCGLPDRVVDGLAGQRLHAEVRFDRAELVAGNAAQ